MSRKLRLHYVTISPNFERAEIETGDGYYVCSVDRCSGEGQRKFRQRARALQHALELYPSPLVTLSPTEC